MNAREPLWAHQQAAFDFVCTLWGGPGRKGAMLAMVMGLGKSRVAIELACAVGAKEILIVCPLRVVEVWRTQFEKYSVFPYDFLALDDRYKSVAEKLREAKNTLAWSRSKGHPLALAINYESARTPPFSGWAVNQIWPLAILDESHRIKQPGGRTSKWAAHLGMVSLHRLALTGTPMAHEPTDIWGQFRFLDPTLLDPAYSSFRARYAVMGGYFRKEVVGWQNLDALEQDFRKIAFRVDDSVLDLPPEMDHTLSCDLGEKGARIYREMEQEMIAWIEAGVAVTAANAMVRLLRLQQITGGTLPSENGNQEVDNAKQNLLTDLLADLREPVVVFARFRSDLVRIHRAAREAEILSAELSGSRDDLAEWQKQPPDKPTVLATQIQAGGVGVDLTRARIAIYYSFGFSLVDYKQSRARIRRPPQKRPCVFYHLEVRDSVDQYVLRAVEARQDLIDSTLKELKKKGASHAVVPHRAAR